MATIGFVGLGNMGGHMARNLVGAGHELKVFDLVPELMEQMRSRTTIRFRELALRLVVGDQHLIARPIACGFLRSPADVNCRDMRKNLEVERFGHLFR